MHRYCLTKLELDRTIRDNRSGEFSPVFFFVMVWWFLFGIIYPLNQIHEAFEAGAEHPFSVLIGGPGVMLVLCEGLSYLLFRVWRRKSLAEGIRKSWKRASFGGCGEED